GSEAQAHSVEAQSRRQLSVRVRRMSKEESMIVHVEGQRQAVGLKRPAQEIEMGQKGFPLKEPCVDVPAAVIVQKIEQRRLPVLVGQPSVGRGVVLPKLADLL